MAQYIEHPALLGMRMGNQASQQRMQGYQQAVDRNTVAQLQAAQDSQKRAYDLAKYRDFLNAGINPISGQPWYGKPQDFGVQQERMGYVEQAGRQSRDPMTNLPLGPNLAPAWDVPFEASDALQVPGPVGPGYKAMSPERRQQLIYNAMPETIDSWFRSAGREPAAKPVERSVNTLR